MVKLIQMNDHPINVAVIGAGASGLLAAIAAARQGASVTLFERNASLGRKLLVTGSGRCNLSNDHVASERYTCADPNWMDKCLNQFGVSELLKTLNAIGVPVYKTWDGWYYPLSNSAHSIVDALSHAIKAAGVHTQTSSQVLDIVQHQMGFRISYFHNANQHDQVFDRVIVSSGGKAYPSLGSKGEMFPVLDKLGHTVLPIHPALAPVLVELGSLKSLQGVRLDLGVSLLKGKTVIAAAAGNLIFTEWGLNGPAVMDISHHIPDPPGDEITLSLNLLHFIETEFSNLLEEKHQTEFPVSLLLAAFFPPKVVQWYMNLLALSVNTPLNKLDDPSVSRLVNQLKKTNLKVLGVRGYKYCQASVGGVPVSEVSPETLESTILPGLYLTGETLDVVGPCGGFNLHFAFASGALAGKAAGLT